MKNAEKLIEKIQREDLKPIPRWYFLTRKIFGWLSYSLFILIGAISFSVILYTIQQSEFFLLKHLGHSLFEFVLVFLPILWLVLLILFLAASILSAKNADKGYKLSFSKWIAYSTGLSIVLGSLFFISGGAQFIEESFANQVELYESVQDKKIEIWSQPEEGNLSGEIISLEFESISLRDFKGKEWTIRYTENSFIAPRVLMEVGEKIKINGQVTDNQIFEATNIRPWGQGFGAGRNKNQKKSKKNTEK